MRTDTYSYEGRGNFSGPVRTVATLLSTCSALWLALALSGCGKENAIVLTIRPPSGIALTEYALTVQDRTRREIVYQSGVQPIDAVARGRDLNAEPLRVGLKLTSGDTFLVHVRASTEKLSAEGVVAPNPRTPEYFFAGITTVSGIVELDAALLIVGPGYDQDFDHFPDSVGWMAGVPEAQLRYQDHLELLDCVDRDPAPGDAPLPVPYYAGQINPLAKPKCGLALDIACEATPPVCKDTDGDGENEATDCDDNDAKRFHGNARPRNCCQCNDRKSCETNHEKLADMNACQPARCDDPFDFDCTGQAVPCFVDDDCDGFSPNDPIASLRDCDDNNPRVHPGAAKDCSDSSHDWACDGAPTAGCTPCDLDGDGFQRTDAANSCPTVGYNKAFDCNDNDRGVFPGSTTFEGVSLIIRNLPPEGSGQEGGGYIAMALRGTCRNKAPAYPTFQTTLQNQDADCDGNARRGCPTAACDVDGDGFPNTNAGCNPSGLPIDCNDGDFRIFPGAPEKCADTVAQGCSSDLPCVNDADGDGYTATYDCDDGNANVHPWAFEMCNGIDDDCDGLIDEGNPDLTGNALTKTYPGGLQGILDCTDDTDGECGKKNGQQALSGRCVCTGTAPTGIVDSARHTSCPGNVTGNTIGPKCFGATQPKLQTCVASTPKDEDCDGSTEALTGTNLFEGGQTCGNNTGECKAGTVIGCQRTGGYQNPFYVGAGAPVSPTFDPERRFLLCSTAAKGPTVEICDGKDNDCNAVADQTCSEISGANTPACCLVSLNPVCKDLNNDFNYCGNCTNQCNVKTADRCTSKACKCGTSNPCSGTMSVCKAGGSCVQCIDDTTCGGATGLPPRCKAASNTCVQCLSSADCGAAAPACDLATNTCVACIDDTTCPTAAPVCNTTTHLCVQCKDDTTCGAGTPKCKTAAQMCVQCLANGDCATAAQSLCSANSCAVCGANADCSHITNKPFCKAATGCVQCLASSSCSGATPICDGMDCQACAADLECSGKDATKPYCDAGPCVECKASANCGTAAKPICSAGKACVACAANAECMAKDMTKPICDAGPCVQCTASANCGAAKPICSAKTCVACTTDAQCLAKDVTKPLCDSANTGMCGVCKTSATCLTAAKPICDPAMLDCRVCMSDAECFDKDMTNPTCDMLAGTCGP